MRQRYVYIVDCSSPMEAADAMNRAFSTEDKALDFMANLGFEYRYCVDTWLLFKGLVRASISKLPIV